MDDLGYRALRLCSGKGSYEAIPTRKQRLALGQLRDAMERIGRPVLDARVMLILGGSPEVTILEDGRILIKTRSEDEARTEMGRLIPFLREAVRHRT